MLVWLPAARRAGHAATRGGGGWGGGGLVGGLVGGASGVADGSLTGTQPAAALVVGGSRVSRTCLRSVAKAPVDFCYDPC